MHQVTVLLSLLTVSDFVVFVFVLLKDLSIYIHQDLFQFCSYAIVVFIFIFIFSVHLVLRFFFRECQLRVD